MGQAQYEPTPEEIAAECREIQRGWTEQDRESRASGVSQFSIWHPPGTNRYAETLDWKRRDNGIKADE